MLLQGKVKPSICPECLRTLALLVGIRIEGLSESCRGTLDHAVSVVAPTLRPFSCHLILVGVVLGCDIGLQLAELSCCRLKRALRSWKRLMPDKSIVTQKCDATLMCQATGLIYSSTLMKIAQHGIRTILRERCSDKL